jgi:photosystem II stability/assembly factor-like uncharacterized protein
MTTKNKTMKKPLLLSTFAFGLFTFSWGQQYGWQDISVNVPGSPDFSDVYFVSDDEGWISVSSGPEIYHTTDGGATFEIQETSLGTSTAAINMIDENEGYTGGGSGFAYRTADGGANWNLLGAISSSLNNMDFASATQGYACGDNGAVFSISPQGVTNLNSVLATNLYGISAPSVNKVWVCGGSTISHFNGSAFEYQLGPGGTYNAICFINDNEGWVVGTAGLMGHTEDGGEDWHRQTNPDPDLHSLYDLFFLDQNNGWAVGSQGTILKTTNGGDTWELDEEGSLLTTNFLTGIHYNSPTNGYVVGNGKTLLKYGEISGIGEKPEDLLFTIFPNPAKGKFGVQSLKFEVENATIELLDLNGRKLLEKQIPAGVGEIEVDVSNLQSGIYFCKIKTESGSATKKLIIQK